jgi:glycine dehydrogenase
MLDSIGATSLEQLVAQTVPATIRLPNATGTRRAASGRRSARRLRAIAGRNRVQHSLIGMGYADTLTPTVVLRNVLENPGWYTAYTPYQAEIAQGRLEALLNYQQMVIDLTGLELANASLLDEATAAAEAMSMARRVSKAKSNLFFVDAAASRRPSTCSGRAPPSSISNWSSAHPTRRRSRRSSARCSSIRTTSAKSATSAGRSLPSIARRHRRRRRGPDGAGAAALAGRNGRRHRPRIVAAFRHPARFRRSARRLLCHPGRIQASVAGRIIGVSVDARGKRALRMALQTREQHIRREKANSNICTSQVLLANMAGMYAVYHGPQGLRSIAGRIHRLAAILAEGLRRAGITVLTRHFFDTLRVDLGSHALSAYKAAVDAGYNLRQVSPGVLGIAVNEKTSRADIGNLIKLITGVNADLGILDEQLQQADPTLPAALLRQDAILTHPVFNTHHTEHQMLRYLKKLQNRDLALDHSMISLGSCTMKLNASSEMIPITWPEFADIHPFAPLDQAQGYLQMIGELETWLKAITGFDAICMQPNSGAQGEYAGLVAIARYHASRGETPAQGLPDPEIGTRHQPGHRADVRHAGGGGRLRRGRQHRPCRPPAKAAQHAATLACLMITYPSTHGVFEESVRISAPSCTSTAARCIWTAPTSTRRSA